MPNATIGKRKRETDEPVEDLKPSWTIKKVQSFEFSGVRDRLLLAQAKREQKGTVVEARAVATLPSHAQTAALNKAENPPPKSPGAQTPGPSTNDPPQASNHITVTSAAVPVSITDGITNSTSVDTDDDQDEKHKTETRKNRTKKERKEAKRRIAKEPADRQQLELESAQRAPTTPEQLLRLPNSDGGFRAVSEDIVEKMVKLHISVPKKPILWMEALEHTGAHKTGWPCGVKEVTHYTFEHRAPTLEEEISQTAADETLPDQSAALKSEETGQDSAEKAPVPRREFDIYAALERYGLPRHLMQFDRPAHTETASSDAQTGPKPSRYNNFRSRPGYSAFAFTNIPASYHEDFDLLATLNTFGARVNPLRDPARIKQWEEKKDMLDYSSPIVAAAAAIDKGKYNPEVPVLDSVAQPSKTLFSTRPDLRSAAGPRISTAETYQTSLLNKLEFAPRPEHLHLAPTRATGRYDPLADIFLQGVEAYDRKAVDGILQECVELDHKLPEKILSTARHVIEKRRKDMEEMQLRLAELMAENKFLRAERETVTEREEQML